MKKEFIAFISFGFPCCGGPEIGEYGKFTVDLTEEELSYIDEAIASNYDGYKREYLQEKYPELHDKIINAGFDLVKEIVIGDDLLACEDFSPEELSEMESMTRKESVDYVLSKHSDWFCTDDEIKDCLDESLCYYLNDDDLPSDYKILVLR